MKWLFTVIWRWLHQQFAVPPKAGDVYQRVSYNMNVMYVDQIKLTRPYGKNPWGEWYCVTDERDSKLETLIWPGRNGWKYCGFNRGV
jgi:hypothetical protein